jgi:hypothetical protein
MLIIGVQTIMRIHEVLAAESIATAGTKVIDLNLSDLVSRITICVKGTNNNAVPTAHPAEIVSKIELVDGSDVLFSLSGKEAQALNFYETGEMPTVNLEFRNAVMCFAAFHINLGRFLWDPKLALDPARFSNLQLKITHNKAAGGSTPSAGELAVFAELMDKTEASPTGFLMAKEIQSYGLVSSAHEYITLPTDYMYRKLMIKSLFSGKQPWEQYNKVKLSIDNDRVVLLNNLRTTDLLKFMSVKKDFVEFIMGTGTGSAADVYCTPAMDIACAQGTLEAALSAANVIKQAYGGVINILSESAKGYQLIVTGKCPHGALDIPFGDQMNPDSWLKMDKVGNLKFDITAGSSVGASSTCEIVSQQLRAYK